MYNMGVQIHVYTSIEIGCISTCASKYKVPVSYNITTYFIAGKSIIDITEGPFKRWLP